jgi:hypothetical protein
MGLVTPYNPKPIGTCHAQTVIIIIGDYVSFLLQHSVLLFANFMLKVVILEYYAVKYVYS